MQSRYYQGCLCKFTLHPISFKSLSGKNFFCINFLPRLLMRQINAFVPNPVI